MSGSTANDWRIWRLWGAEATVSLVTDKNPGGTTAGNSGCMSFMAVSGKKVEDMSFGSAAQCSGTGNGWEKLCDVELYTLGR